MSTTVIILSAAVFVALILNLAVKSELGDFLTGGAAFLAMAGGLILYSLAYTELDQDVPLAIVRTLYAVCGMFMGKNESPTVGNCAVLKPLWTRLLFWFFHVCALYATASAAIKTVGERAMRRLRLFLLRRGRLVVIYGARADTVSFGQQMLARRKCSVVFVDEHPDPSCIQTIRDSGCVLRTDRAATTPGRAFLNSVGVYSGTGRRISLFALQQSEAANLRFARGFLSALSAQSVSPDHTDLLLLGGEQIIGDSLQAGGDGHGFGNVAVIDEAGLSARLMTGYFPPSKTLKFGADGKAEEDFEAMIIGFGHGGQAALRSLVMNGQFYGSNFRATVFDPKYESLTGRLYNDFGEIFTQYRIDFHKADGRSREAYDFIRESGRKLKYIVIAAGDDKANLELSEELRRFYERRQHRPLIFELSRRGVRKIGFSGEPDKMLTIFRPEVMDGAGPDAAAIRLNHFYCGDNGKTPEQNWKECSYFNRMSSRASSDFVPSMIYAAGKTPQQVLDGDWDLTEAQKENLSRTEHLRWCAFHYAMGYAAMTEEEFDYRAEEYREEKEKTGKSSVRIAKDAENRRHACLIPWEALDALSAKENAVTGGHVDYKNMDLVNVLAVPKLIAPADIPEEKG